MEDSRLNINISENTFTDIYQVAGVTVGTKLALQNLSPAEITVCIASTPEINKGFAVQPYEYYIVPAGSSGCFLKASTKVGATVGIQLGAWSVLNAPIDERVYNGLKGLTVQPFIEANVKNGTQWELSFEKKSVIPEANVDFVFTTGSKYVLVKSRSISFTGSEVEVSVYKNTIFTAGTSVQIYNLNTSASTVLLSTGFIDAIVTNPGTEIAAKGHAFGVSSNVNQASGTFTVSGLERVLSPNTTYLLRTTNKDTIAINIAAYLTFYEGEISSLN